MKARQRLKVAWGWREDCVSVAVSVSEVRGSRWAGEGTNLWVVSEVGVRERDRVPEHTSARQDASDHAPHTQTATSILSVSSLMPRASRSSTSPSTYLSSTTRRPGLSTLRQIQKLGRTPFSPRRHNIYRYTKHARIELHRMHHTQRQPVAPKPRSCTGCGLSY